MQPVEILKNIGLSEKAARVYLASLELGETSVQKLAERAGLKRTTVYYVLEELISFGALIETKQNKKIAYIPTEPTHLLRRAKEHLNDFEAALDIFEERKHAIYTKPQILLFYGPAGFKEIWDMIFSSKEKEFRIITPAQS
ncbi:MAG: helix-turn-helix domain-containing protein, partial [Patescibacteria group bacterium]